MVADYKSAVLSYKTEWNFLLRNRSKRHTTIIADSLILINNNKKNIR